MPEIGHVAGDGRNLTAGKAHNALYLLFLHITQAGENTHDFLGSRSKSCRIPVINLHKKTKVIIFYLIRYASWYEGAWSRWAGPCFALRYGVWLRRLVCLPARFLIKVFYHL